MKTNLRVLPKIAKEYLIILQPSVGTSAARIAAHRAIKNKKKQTLNYTFRSSVQVAKKEDLASDDTVIYEVPDKYKQKSGPTAEARATTKSKFTFWIRVVGLKQHWDNALQQKYDQQLKFSKDTFGVTCVD